MANNNSSTVRGKYLCKEGLIDIYSKTTHKVEGKGKEAKKTSTTVFGLYFAKKSLGASVTTKAEAIAKAKELMEGGVDSLRSNGKKK